MKTTKGQFVWFDLMTTDVPAAKSFYGDIIGWKTTRWSGGDYEMWTAGDKQVAGVMALSAEARKASPPQWLAYISTENVDASAQRAQKLGGRIVGPATDIPSVGRYAAIADPQGARFALFSPADPASDPHLDTKALGHFSWAELNTTDYKSAWKFYSELFAWTKTDSMDMGPELGEYFMFGADPKQTLGGMSDAAKVSKAPPHWLQYINVKNVDETAKTIPQKGGKVLGGPMDVPGGDRVAQCMDPQGAMFAIYSGKHP